MQGYGTTARLFHWITALLILSTIPVGAIMVREGLARPVQDTLFIYHKNVGVIVLVLVLLRLAWRALNPPPPVPAGLMPLWQERLSAWVHRGLYAMLLFMGLTGFVRVSAGGFPIEMLDWLGVPRLPRNIPVADAASTLHFYGKFVLVGLVLLHVAGALHHALLKRDGLMARMWPPVAPR